MRNFYSIHVFQMLHFDITDMYLTNLVDMEIDLIDPSLVIAFIYVVAPKGAVCFV